MAVESALPRFTHYIDGGRVEPMSGGYLPTDDPYSGRTWANVARGDAEDVKRAVESATSIRVRRVAGDDGHAARTRALETR